MRLLLTVLSGQRANLGENAIHEFGVRGGVLGRSASCDWALPDATNTLSGRHATIAYNGHGFVITDTSTNGVYHNAVDAPLGRGQSAPLASGDSLYVADYVISVAILKDPDLLKSQQLTAMPVQATGLGAYYPAPAQAPSPRSPAGATDPLALLSDDAEPGPYGLTVQDLLGPIAAPPRPMQGVAAPSAPPSTSRLNSPQIPEMPHATPSPVPNAPRAIIPDDLDFGSFLLGPEPASSFPPLAAHGSDPATAAGSSVRPPQIPRDAVPPPIPSDFSQDFARPSPPLPPVPRDNHLPDVALPRTVSAQMPFQTPPQAPPQMPRAAESGRQSVPFDPVAMLRQRAATRAATLDLQRPTADPHRGAEPRQPRIDNASSGAVALPGGSGASDWETSFWSAVGVDPDSIPPELRQDVAAELGRALRETAAGLVAILGARKTLKDEFRIDQTRLAPSENNPFKFFRTGDDVLRRMIVEATPGFLPLGQAVRRGFVDIKAHEVATVVAMQSALRLMLTRNAPAAIEAGAEKSGLLGRRPDKAKLWDRYVEAHEALTADLDQTIREILAAEFARAYAQQVEQAFGSDS